LFKKKNTSEGQGLFCSSLLQLGHYSTRVPTLYDHYPQLKATSSSSWWSSGISPSGLKRGPSLPSLQPPSESSSSSKSFAGSACIKSSQLIIGSNSIARISESTAAQLGQSFALHPSTMLSPTVQSKGPMGKFSQL
jgi:hypothetical protein